MFMGIFYPAMASAGAASKTLANLDQGDPWKGPLEARGSKK